jgi:hypothetical protein
VARDLRTVVVLVVAVSASAGRANAALAEATRTVAIVANRMVYEEGR